MEQAEEWITDRQYLDMTILENENKTKKQNLKLTGGCGRLTHFTELFGLDLPNLNSSISVYRSKSKNSVGSSLI